MLSAMLMTASSGERGSQPSAVLICSVHTSKEYPPRRGMVAQTPGLQRAARRTMTSGHTLVVIR